MKDGTIKINNLARVEGEGALYVKIRKDRVEDVRLNIFEPPRFFEAFLRGRSFAEAPDITARICGICPVAYQMSSVHAMENALGIEVNGPLRALRRMIYCGEWIESHALHVAMLHAPDFLGYEDAIRMAKDHPGIVERGLRLKKAGNEIMSLLGGREVHPINVRVGGFYKVPTRRGLAALEEHLKRAREDAIEMVRWAAGLPYPEFDQDYEFVALRHPQDYPMNEGRLVSNRGWGISVPEYESAFVEEQVAHSHALQSRFKNRGAYLVGPMARYNLNFDRLSPVAQEAARAAGLPPVCRNPFRSIVIRCVEILYACDEALRLINEYAMPEKPAAEVRPGAGTGFGCTEAPRGILYHRYRLDDQGLIQEAKIVPPTSQNQKTIENDLRNFVQTHIDWPKEKLGLRCEQAIRNHDPCISCATHFLRVQIDELGSDQL